ncbi:hypothetical protein GCM10023151_04340 [Kangiella marina]|uniref:AsmA domain-containing protein n=2 Tax=Kangiella marina TaxID=1079178 RepID=A0ABP8ID31_9GAMM
MLLFLAVSVFVYIINSESYLEDYLSEHLGVEATVGELDVSLLSGTVKISSSVIGPKDDPFIQFDSLEGELDYSHLWSSQLTVELLKLTNAKVRYPFEFNFKQSEENTEDTSLPFDFIDVAAIDIHNLNFEYRGDVSLVAEGGDVKVRNLPVAEDGFLLFGDLQRLVKASETTLEANLKTLRSEKTTLNNLSLNAHIEQQRLIIDEINSGQSSININLLEHSKAAAATGESQGNSTSNIPSVEVAELDLPFNDIVIEKIHLGKTDLAIQDQQEFSVKAIEAEFSELLLVQDKKALWLDWPSFYEAQNSQFQLSSEAMKSDVIDFESLSLKGNLKAGDFLIPSFSLNQPVLKLAPKAENDSSASADLSGLLLPFKTVTLVGGEITQGKISLAYGDDKHEVSQLNLELKQLPLVMNQKPVFLLDKVNVGEQQASVVLSDANYQGSLGTISKMSSTVSLKNSEVNVEELKISQPNINYQLVAVKKESDTSSSDAEITLPVDTIHLGQLTLDGAQFTLESSGQTYAGQGLKLTGRDIPLYSDATWVVAEPKSWQKQAESALSADSLELPQGSLSGVSVDAVYQNNQLTINKFTLAGSDLSIDAEADDNNPSAPSNEALPLDYVQLNNIDLKRLNIKYQNQDLRYQLSGANLSLSSFPLVREGELVSDPVSYSGSETNRVAINVGELVLPEGRIRGFETRGTLRNKDLMLDYFRTNSADLKFLLSDQGGETNNTPSEAETPTANKFALRTFKIGDLKLQGINAELSRGEGESAQTYSVKNGYLGATEIMLAKNHQTIDQWYHSQLENAFTLIALKVEQVQQEQNIIHNITATAVQDNQIVTVQPLRMMVNEAPLSARWIIDLSQQPYQSTYISDFNDLSLDKLVVPADEKGVSMSGNLKGDIDIAFLGLQPDVIRDSLQGKVLITNQTPLTLHRLNVNKVLRSFLDSQSFGLLDFGGFLLAGPLGLLASQGVSLQDTLGQLGADEGDTHITHFNLDMDIENGVLTTKDVAAATLKYRFAFNGQIDLAQQEFKDFEFDIINEKGCSEYGQTLNGSLISPEIETFTAAFDAVTGSVVGLFKQGVGLITGGACSAVYEGVVPHPEDGAEIIPKEQQRTIDPNAPEEEQDTESAETTEAEEADSN